MSDLLVYWKHGSVLTCIYLFNSSQLFSPKPLWKLKNLILKQTYAKTNMYTDKKKKMEQPTACVKLKVSLYFQNLISTSYILLEILSNVIFWHSHIDVKSWECKSTECSHLMLAIIPQCSWLWTHRKCVHGCVCTLIRTSCGSVLWNCPSTSETSAVTTWWFLCRMCHTCQTWRRLESP